MTEGASAISWRPDDEGQLHPFLEGRDDVRVVWTAQKGSQEKFLKCPITEALYAGNRGGGKTDALLMDFAQFVGRGFGRDWRGILFRRTFPELRDIIAKSMRWYSEIFPGATYNQSSHEWTFETGEVLILSFMERQSDYYRYHGHAYPWIGWEELTNWSSDECYRMMFSTLRSSNKKVPRRVRATCNPYGVGHNWVKARFGLPVPHGKIRGDVIRTPGEPDRVAVRSDLSENLILLDAEPNYRESLAAAAPNPAALAAWRDGSWDIVAGGMFDDLWTPAVHIVPPIPIASIPPSWRLDRAYDDGQSHPFSVGWWAQSSGEPITWEGRVIGPVRGDLIRVQEWYGWSGVPNKGLQLASREIAKGIVEREKLWGITGRVKSGPADGAIFNSDPRDPGSSVASEMAKQGVSWERADKRPGSRKQGWQMMRGMLKGSMPGPEGRREHPGLFVSSLCTQFLRTIPVLARDEKDPDDVDTDAEDHIADEARYRVRRPRVVEKSQPFMVF